MSQQELTSTERVHQALKDCLDDELRDGMNGGIAPKTIAQRLDLTQSTISECLNRLVNDGELIQIHGYPRQGSVNGGPRPSYLPRGHPDAPQHGQHRQGGERV